MSYAIQIRTTGDAAVLNAVELARPEVGAGQVRVRNHATAVNFIDTIIRRGEMPEGMMPALPHIPGVEGAGVVEAVGAGVEHLAVGDRVAWMGVIGAGGYGSHSVIDAEYVVRLPENLSFESAAALPVNGMTAWHMLANLGHAQAGQSLLIHAAAGGVGTLAIQLAKSLGMTVIASVSTAKVEFARAQGADFVIDYRSEDLAARVDEITQGRGVDLTLNPVAGGSLKTDLELLAPMGSAILFGFLAGVPEGNFAEDLAKHFGKSVAVRVSDIYSYYRAEPKAFRRDFEQLIARAARGELIPVIQHCLSLADAARAHQLLESGQVLGKLVLDTSMAPGT